METTQHIDRDERKLSESLLEKGVKTEIVQNITKADKKCSPFFRQVSVLHNLKIKCVDRNQVNSSIFRSAIGCQWTIIVFSGDRKCDRLYVNFNLAIEC